jgi:hypothetical protein
VKTQTSNPVPAPIARVIDTHNGHAIVSNFACYGREEMEHNAKSEAHHTGHVWAEIQCGMGVNRINVTPDEARRIAAMLLEVAEAMDPSKPVDLLDAVKTLVRSQEDPASAAVDALHGVASALADSNDFDGRDIVDRAIARLDD